MGLEVAVAGLMSFKGTAGHLKEVWGSVLVGFDGQSWWLVNVQREGGESLLTMFFVLLLIKKKKMFFVLLVYP